MSGTGPRLTSKDKEIFDTLQVLSHQLDIQSPATNTKQIENKLKVCLHYFKHKGHNVNYLGNHQGYSVTLKSPEARGRLSVFASFTGDTKTIFPDVLPTSKTNDVNVNQQEETSRRRKLACSA